jgi:hypothetical protein
MPDEEWIKTLKDGRRVKFIYQKLPEDGAFLTAQIERNEVVYSVLLTKAKNPLSREDVERFQERARKAIVPLILEHYTHHPIGNGRPYRTAVHNSASYQLNGPNA